MARAIAIPIDSFAKGMESDHPGLRTLHDLDGV
jgi:hypothetical protein